MRAGPLQFHSGSHAIFDTELPASWWNFPENIGGDDMEQYCNFN
jgi:hypothetical protein